MIKLFETNHPTVLRRLVKELNNQQAGFFTNGLRFNRAQLNHGQLECRVWCNGWEVMGFEQFFSDVNGKQICASRTKKGY